MEASGTDIALWLVFRAEQTSSPNVLEANLKVIKCFRHSANKPVWDYPVADSVLMGLLKTKETKPRSHLGLEPEMVQRLIHKATHQFG